MKVLIEFKNGEQIKKECKQVFVNSNDNELDIIYGAFDRDTYNLLDILYFNIENN